jgi:hypothetical protein
MVSSWEPNCATFHGPDGCGKTTIAESLAKTISENTELSTFKLGGSRYREWLTPDIAKDFLSDSDRLLVEPRNPNEKTDLYEDIAIACYGYAKRLVDEGNNVVIDSDPYFKRLMWSCIRLPEDDYTEYKNRLEDKMFSSIGDIGPEIVVGVNMTEIYPEKEAINLFDRITERAGVSEYDPIGQDEVVLNINASTKIWEELILKRASKRLLDARIFTIKNENSKPECVDTVSRDLSIKMFDKFSDVSTNRVIDIE